MLRDKYGEYFWKLPQRFQNAIFEGEEHILLPTAKPLVYKILSEKDRRYHSFLRSFIYRDVQDDIKIISLAGPVGIGKTHMMCSCANFIRCYRNRTFFNWQDLTWSLLKELNLSQEEFVYLLLEFGYLFIDDIKFSNDLQISVFSSLITSLYNDVNHPGIIFTQNWDQESGDVKELWLELVPEYIADRLFNMTQFIKMKGGSRRKEVI